MMNLKDKWKNGQIVIEDFIVDSQKYKRREFTKELPIQALQDIRLNLIDLMKDIEVLTEVDYPKLLSHNVNLSMFQIFSNEESMVSNQDEIQIKVLLQQLRQQSQGKVTLWDLDLEAGHQNFKVIIRNLKTNLMHTIRENLQLKTYHFLPKKDSSFLEEDIRRVVFQILRGMKK